MATVGADQIASHEPKKKWTRRSSPDRSQRVRRTVQWLFIALNAWIGLQFFLWVRYFERGGNALYVARPPGVDGWLPIAGLMNSKYFFLTGRVPTIHPAAMYLFLGFVLMSVLLKKAFCSWLCPVGTFSETCGRWDAGFWDATFGCRNGRTCLCADSSTCCSDFSPGSSGACRLKSWTDSCRRPTGSLRM